MSISRVIVISLEYLKWLDINFLLVKFEDWLADVEQQVT